MEKAPASRKDYELDSDFVFFDASDPQFGRLRQSAQFEQSTKAQKPERLKPRERVFYARLGAMALAAAMAVVPVSLNHAAKVTAATETESLDDIPDDAPDITYGVKGDVVFDSGRPTIVFEPIVDVTDTSSTEAAMTPLEEAKTEFEIPVESLGLSRPGVSPDLNATLDSMLVSEITFANESTSTQSVPTIPNTHIPLEVPVISENPLFANLPDITTSAPTMPTTAETTTAESALTATEPAKAWEGKILNSYDGHIDGPSGDETYYNLPMDHIVDRMHRMGVEGEYWVREDGVKMLGNFIMVAANLKVHPRGSIVETSLGTGIVCDTGDFAKNHPNRLDIATNW